RTRLPTATLPDSWSSFQHSPGNHSTQHAQEPRVQDLRTALSSQATGVDHDFHETCCPFRPILSVQSFPATHFTPPPHHLRYRSVFQQVLRPLLTSAPSVTTLTGRTAPNQQNWSVHWDRPPQIRTLTVPLPPPHLHPNRSWWDGLDHLSLAHPDWNASYAVR